MSATSAATILPFPQVSPTPGVDVNGLLRLTHLFPDIRQAHIEVLEDLDGAEVRFLCRASRAAFETREEFVAAAVKRYLGCIADPRLAEMMFVASLFQAGMSQRISAAVVRERLARAFPGQPPAVWLEHLSGPDLLDAVALNPHEGNLELVVRDGNRWVYALAEG